MISEMAMIDVDALKADGITVSPRDICRLNALGVKVEQAAKASAFYVLPRVAFLGDIAIHEPTIGDVTWIAEAGRRFDMDDIETVALLQATCLSAREGELPDAQDREAVMSSIKEFQSKAARFTLSQILSALSYALHGSDLTVGEHGPAKDADDAEEERRDDVPPVVAGVIRDGLALHLGTISELMKMRQSQIVAAAEAAVMMQHGPDVFKSSRSSAFGEYMRALEAVRKSAEKPANETDDASLGAGDLVPDGKQDKPAEHDKEDGRVARSNISIVSRSHCEGV